MTTDASTLGMLHHENSMDISFLSLVLLLLLFAGHGQHSHVLASASVAKIISSHIDFPRSSRQSLRAASGP
ncbi:hypothetical protein BCR43DRAFT_485972 [Syncephalastrum racemosum]|uniref:Uncharacterized protein n=1 Tax=Syncephalastrum racemosum TaxID=13706 RepID=A0A1X2HPQ3_SYNRA|nr:hypothetical protein BCR43DRAFT_485972 [Syncephalastrum racemosum]